MGTYTGEHHFEIFELSNPMNTSKSHFFSLIYHQNRCMIGDMLQGICSRDLFLGYEGASWISTS